MIFDHTVHAEPSPGDTVSPCCGLTLSQLPRADWLTRNPADVTCGTLTDRDIELLLGGPPGADRPRKEPPREESLREEPVAQPATDQFIFELAIRIRATCRPHGRNRYRTVVTTVWH